MQIIRTLDELEAKIAECNAALARDGDDAMRRLFATFSMDFSRELPADPFSADYRALQFAIYRRVAGRDYAIANERTAFDLSDPATRPFPFSTNSCRTAGHHFMAVGFLLRTLDLTPGARVIEFGPGWGHTTIALARLGMRVTAVEVEPNYCAHLRAEARRHGLDIEVIESDFFYAERVIEPYDAALFFECFHHCDDHLRLLAALRGAVKPEGFVSFGAEPIVADYPVPWGVRVDGEALWAMRNFGWLELGFREAYFEQALARTGWTAHRSVSADSPWVSVWTARRGPLPLSEAVAPLSEPVAPACAAAASKPEGVAAPDRADLLALELASVYRSTSWRLTAPLRGLKRALTVSR